MAEQWDEMRRPPSGGFRETCCVGGNCTHDLQVMSLTSYYCSTPLRASIPLATRFAKSRAHAAFIYATKPCSLKTCSKSPITRCASR